METKKNERSNLENFSKIFMLLGLVLSLLVAYGAIEFKSRETETTYDDNASRRAVIEEEIPETEQKLEEIKPQDLPPPPPVIEEIKVVDDKKNIVETVLQSTEVTQKEKVVIREIKEVEVEEEVVEDVPFSIIEDVPVFPGCKGSKDELKQCFSDKVKDLVIGKFNRELVDELGLTPGSVQRVFVMFRIDKNGNITDVQARGPHKRLEAEAIRVAKLIPKMTPGKQRGRPVSVPYNLPITLKVSE